MSEGTATFDLLCRSVDPAKRLESMSNRKLGVLVTYLSGYSSGIPSLLLAMASTEATKRWLAETTEKHKTDDCIGAMGEGFLP